MENFPKWIAAIKKRLDGGRAGIAAKRAILALLCAELDPPEGKSVLFRPIIQKKNGFIVFRWKNRNKLVFIRVSDSITEYAMMELNQNCVETNQASPDSWRQIDSIDDMRRLFEWLEPKTAYSV